MKYRYCRWIALFTGASAGLCPEFMNAIYADSRYGLIREVWLIDKDLKAMQSIADRFPGKKVRMILLDLSDLQQNVPFISAHALKENTGTDCGEEEAEALLKNYKKLLYNDLFDTKHRLQAFYSYE